MYINKEYYYFGLNLSNNPCIKTKYNLPIMFPHFKEINSYELIQRTKIPISKDSVISLTKYIRQM